VLHRLDELLDHVEHHLSSGLHTVHLADDLPHEIVRELLCAAPRDPGSTRDTALGLPHERTLERHGQRIGGVVTRPLVGPCALQHPRRLTGERARPHRVARPGRQELLLHDGVRLGLIGREPDRATPHAGGAECERRGELTTPCDTARGENRERTDGVDHFGDEHHRGDLARVPPGFGPLGDDEVDTGGLMPNGVRNGAGEGGYRYTSRVAPIDHGCGRGPQRADEQTDRVGERDVEERLVATRVDRHTATHTTPITVVVGQRWDAVAGEDVVDELLLRRREETAHGVTVETPRIGALVLRREEEIDSVGASLHLLVDPGEVDVELLRCVRDPSEYTETTGVRHGRHDVAAVTEGEDRELDTQHFTHRCSHIGLQVVVGRVAPRNVSAIGAEVSDAQRCHRPALRSGCMTSPNGDRIVHAADLHLGAPLASLGRHIGAEAAERIRRRAAEAFDRLVDLTIDEGARALVLAGDVYDTADREVSAQLRFRRGMERLVAEGVRVYIAHGNHDPLVDRYRPAARLPEGVVVFPPGVVERHEVPLGDGTSLTVCGTSFADIAERSNLAQRFLDIGTTPERTVGVLHANVSGSVGHDDYAPCTVDDLDAAPVGYWALGHVHQRTVRPLGPGRWWAYSGNLQGRSTKPTECGAKGALVVGIDRQGFSEPRFVACDTVRFARLDVHVGGAQDAETALGLVAEAVETAAVDAGDRPVLARVRLVGPTLAHAQLVQIGDITDIVRRSVGGDIGEGEILKVEVATTVAVDRHELLDRADLIAALLRELDALGADPGAATALLDALEPMVRSQIDVSDPSAIARVIERAEVLLLDRLVAP
jgi:DNA repair protein SbcD/Mre11